jgi:hypothetical protein
MALNTLGNSAGNSQAAVNAQTAPLLEPPIVPIARKFYRPAIARFAIVYKWKNFIQQKSRVPITQPVILEASVETINTIFVLSNDLTRRYKNANRYWHLSLSDEIIKNYRCIPLDAVLVHVNASRFISFILSGDVNTDLARCTWKYFGIRKSELHYFTFGYSGALHGGGINWIGFLS